MIIKAFSENGLRFVVSKDNVDEYNDLSDAEITIWRPTFDSDNMIKFRGKEIDSLIKALNYLRKI